MIGLTAQQIALGACVLLAFGYVLLGSIWLIPSKRAVGGEMLRTLNVAVLILVALIGSFLVGGPVQAVLMVALAMRIGFEAGHVRLGPNRAFAVSAATGVIVALAVFWSMAQLLYVGLWCLLAVRLIAMPNWQNRTLHGSAELLVFPVLPLGILTASALTPYLGPAMLACYILVETFDSYSLLTGKVIGRTKAFPHLSPRKTVEGLLGGVVGLMATAAIVALALDLNVFGAILFAMAVGVFGLAGDLGASRLKRNAGVKDFPVVFKSQGGLFDTFDSWIAAGAGISALYVLTSLT